MKLRAITQQNLPQHVQDVEPQVAYDLITAENNNDVVSVHNEKVIVVDNNVIALETYERGVFSYVSSVECRHGLIHPECHRTRFTDTEKEFLETIALKHDRHSKLSYRTIAGQITIQQFRLCSRLCYEFQKWRRGW